MHLPTTFLWLAAAFLVLRFALRPLIALVFGGQIGERVLARQPKELHLEVADARAARKPEALEAQAQALVREGFSDAGWFTAPEFPDLVMRMLVHEPEGWLATVHEHRRVGQWVEIGMRFPDETRISFSTLRDTGLAPLRGVQVTHMAGASLETVLRTARAARAKRDMTPLTVSVSQAPRIFEAGYAKVMALRQDQGISRREVVAVASRPPLTRKAS